MPHRQSLSDYLSDSPAPPLIRCEGCSTARNVMKTHCLTATSATLCVLLLSASCHAMDYGEGHANLAPIALLDNNQGQHGHWKAIGRLQPYKQHKTSYCSAALIDTRGASSDTSGPACAYQWSLHRLQRTE